MHTQRSVYTWTHTDAHGHTLGHTQMRMDIDTDAHAHGYTHAHTNGHTNAHAHGHTNVHAYRHVHTDTQMDMHTDAHGRTQMHMHIHINAHTDTRAQTLIARAPIPEPNVLSYPCLYIGDPVQSWLLINVPSFIHSTNIYRAPAKCNVLCSGGRIQCEADRSLCLGVPTSPQDVVAFPSRDPAVSAVKCWCGARRQGGGGSQVCSPLRSEHGDLENLAPRDLSLVSALGGFPGAAQWGPWVPLDLRLCPPVLELSFSQPLAPQRGMGRQPGAGSLWPRGTGRPGRWL